MWCFPRFCSWSLTFHHVYLSSQYPYLFSIIKNHLYADDTQIFFSFYAPDFPSNISYLFNALQHISSWMTANLLTFNTSKTKFLLIGLKQQLAKIQNCNLNTTHSARNLGFIFDEHLTFSDQISALSKTANTIATSIVDSKLDYCNSLYYNLLYSQLNRLQQIQNCLARAVFKAPKFTHPHLFLNLYTGSKSISVLSIKFFLLHIKFLLLLNLATSEILSLLTHLILKLVLLLLLPSLAGADWAAWQPGICQVGRLVRRPGGPPRQIQHVIVSIKVAVCVLQVSSDTAYFTGCM